ncbi:uncharacterized protein TNCV_2109961 [Trichonephila clavipes]|nr:uncharacterized protein TNCV_2109961 [Trichonephila clavipes]
MTTSVMCSRPDDPLAIAAIKRHEGRGLGSNPGEDMDVCKCIVPSRHRGTLSSRRAASPLVRLVAGDERWETPDPPQGCSSSK